MSACADVRSLMLEAEPAELRGEGGSRVATHVRDCPSCARVAERILVETGALEAWLASGGTPSAERVAALLREAGATASRPAGRRFRSVRSWGWAPVAAAAAVAAVLLTERGRMEPAPRDATPRVAALAPPVVRPAPDQDVAVFQTDNPDITVVWLF